MHSIDHVVSTGLVLFSLFVICYYAVVNGWYLVLHVLALLELREDVREARWDPPFRKFASPFYPGIGIVAPAYNEETTIVESVQSMLSLNYPKLEVVVVNDGSTDATLPRLIENFDLEAVDADIPFDVPAEEIHDVYRSTTDEKLLVVDKENGGKSDALNAGIWLTEMRLFCAVDSDTVIDRNALLSLVRPFLEAPTTAVASGGVIRVANECTIEDGVVEEVALPKTGLPGLQVMEYLRAFYSGRLGLNRINGLILISGAFGLFQTDAVREIGGYRHDTVTEDFDIVMRLHRHFKETDRKYTVDITRGVSKLTLSLSGEAEFVEMHPPEYVVTTATAFDSKTGSEFEILAAMEMDDAEDGVALAYRAEVTYSGGAAGISKRVLRPIVERDVNTYFENVRQRVEG